MKIAVELHSCLKITYKMIALHNRDSSPHILRTPQQFDRCPVQPLRQNCLFSVRGSGFLRILISFAPLSAYLFNCYYYGNTNERKCQYGNLPFVKFLKNDEKYGPARILLVHYFFIFHAVAPEFVRTISQLRREYRLRQPIRQ